MQSKLGKAFDLKIQFFDIFKVNRILSADDDSIKPKPALIVNNSDQSKVTESADEQEAQAEIGAEVVEAAQDAEPVVVETAEETEQVTDIAAVVVEAIQEQQALSETAAIVEVVAEAEPVLMVEIVQEPEPVLEVTAAVAEPVAQVVDIIEETKTEKIVPSLPTHAKYLIIGGGTAAMAGKPKPYRLI
jgi:hypothetical protein